MRRLPPLNALRIFEVAPRTGSYVEAGVELGLTHGAVSRQIASLEDCLGQRLFVRVGRRMAATPAARAFASEVTLAFDRIVAGAEAVGKPSARHVLRVSAPATFAMRWLIPRLERFHAEHPDVEVTVTTTTTLYDDLRGGFDVAVRRGTAERGVWPQYRAVPFLGEADTILSARRFSNAPRYARRATSRTMSCSAARRDRAIGATGWSAPACRIDLTSAARFTTISLSPCRPSPTASGMEWGPCPCSTSR